VRYVFKEFKISIRQACWLFKLSTSVFYYQPVPSQDGEIIEAIDGLLKQDSDWGFWKLFKTLRNQGKRWNHKRVYRIYLKMKLNIRKRAKKRLPARVKDPLVLPIGPNITWSMDFMQDTLSNGRKFRTLNVIDDFNREALSIAIETSISGHRVVHELNNIIFWRGKPEAIRIDNGPEFICKLLEEWAASHGIRLIFIQPGKPTQNSYIERFNQNYRKGVLDKYLFEDLDQVRIISNEWIWRYNNIRPHDSLMDLTPRQFLLKYGKVDDFPTFQQDINMYDDYQKSILLSVAS
jgi:putative transposase